MFFMFLFFLLVTNNIFCLFCKRSLIRFQGFSVFLLLFLLLYDLINIINTLIMFALLFLFFLETLRFLLNCSTTIFGEELPLGLGDSVELGLHVEPVSPPLVRRESAASRHQLVVRQLLDLGHILVNFYCLLISVNRLHFTTGHSSSLDKVRVKFV